MRKQFAIVMVAIFVVSVLTAIPVMSELGDENTSNSTLTANLEETPYVAPIDLAIVSAHYGELVPVKPILGFKNSKVIVSHLGELTRDVRHVGDVIRYRIYYLNEFERRADIRILDELDGNLYKVTVFDDGKYDERAHAVTWKVEGVPAGRGGFVEFEVVIGKARSIKNKAMIQIGEKKIVTNIVETTVCGQPELGWIPFDKVSKPGEAPRSYMKDETTMSTTVNFDVPGMFVHEIKADGATYHRLSIPGHATLLALGKPELPIIGQAIEVPHGVNFDIDIVKSKSIMLEGYNIFPAQEREIRQVKSKEEKFALDKSTYLTDGYYPTELATIKAEDIGVIRGHRVVFLKVNPIQYNPVTRELKAFSQIEVRLKYDQPAQIQPVEGRIASEAFEELLRASVLNYKDDSRFDRGDARDDQERDGCDYLIITHGDFYTASDVNNPIVRLRDWKRCKGYKTRVVDVANIPGGQTADKIKSYLQNAYDHWYPPPTYVLLVGDAEFIPTNYETAHSSHSNTDVGTDLYYATVDGTDYFPDIFTGRLSVDTLAQAEDVIDKILTYEQNPPANANYYTDTSLVCLFEDDTDLPPPPDSCPENGREDCTFRIIEFAEEVRTYLQNNGYNCARIYDQSGNFAQGPQRYENDASLPAELTIAGDPAVGIPGFPWNGATADITNAVNNGNFIVTYSGHGGRGSWGRPGFNTANVGALTNGILTPVVFSFACKAGWFDNEIDDGSLGTGNNDECFCEHFLRHGSGGAVAIIGATRNSWDPNDFMMLGAFEAIWPDFAPNPPFSLGSLQQLPNVEMGSLFRMGQVHTFSKVYMANAYAHDTFRQLTFEMYHLFGDPEMPVWTEEPARFKVEHPEGIGSTGEQDFIVKVTDDGSGGPVQSAVVVLTRDSSIIAVRQTNPAGIARFTLNAPASGKLNITITAHNYRPYEGEIKVTSGGAMLNRLEPNNGVENQVIHVGGQNFFDSEDVKIYFGDQLMLTHAATGGSFGQSGIENVDIQVPSGYPLGPVNIIALGETLDRYAVNVFQVRTANPIDLYTYDQWDSTTWHLHTGDNPTWNNPEIQLYDSGGHSVGSNNLIVGNTYTIKVKVHNDADFDAEDVTVTFKWADFGLGQSEREWHYIDKDPLDVPAHSVGDAEVNWAPPYTGHLCVLVEIYYIEDINESNNKGQENCHVGPTSSPAEVSFLIWNPTDKPVAVYLELRQLVRPDQEQKERLWGSWIRHPDPQLIPPGEKRTAVVIIDPDLADIKRGEAEFALTGFINGKVVGGVNFIIIKK